MAGNIEATGRRASAAAGRAAGDWRATLARVGLAAMGLLYIVVGLLVIQVALGDKSADEANQRGAIERLMENTAGAGCCSCSRSGCSPW